MNNLNLIINWVGALCQITRITRKKSYGKRIEYFECSVINYTNEMKQIFDKRMIEHYFKL